MRDVCRITKVRQVLGAASVLILMSMATTTAAAHDHRPPAIWLQQEAASQKGSLQSYCWYDDFLSGTCGDLKGNLRAEVDIAPDSDVDITITKSQPPHSVVVEARRRGQGAGGSTFEELPAELEPQLASDGSVTWALRVDCSSLDGRYLVRLTASWFDEHGNPFPEEAVWLFAVKAGR